MPIVLKDLEELKSLGQTYELDPRKKYLMLIPVQLPQQQLEMLSVRLDQLGLNVNVIAGVDAKIYEMEVVS